MKLNPLLLLKRPGWRGMAIGVACALAAWLATRAPLFLGLEEWMQDGSFSFRGKRSTRTNVVIIGLDDKSFEKLDKPLLFLSEDLAQVVAYAKEQGAHAVGLDLIVPESYATRVPVEGAEQLGQAIDDAGIVALSEWKLEQSWLKPLPQWLLKYYQSGNDPRFLGFVNLTEDNDYFLRRQQLLAKEKGPAGETLRYHLALAVYALAERKEIAWDNEQGRLKIGSDVIPLEDQRLPINFVGPAGTFPVISFSDVLRAARNKEKMPALDRAIVLVGVTARSQQDYHATPFSNNFWRALVSDYSGLMSGPEIHANIIATLHDRVYIRSLPAGVSLGLLLAAGALLGRVFSRLNLAWGLGLAFGLHYVWKGVCLAAFSYADLRLEFLPMLTLGILAYLATLGQRWWTLRKMLGVFKSDNIARALENDPGHLDLRGEERILTVLFADIRGFTDFSENHRAREVVKLLNTYFAAIVPIIEEHGGTLNQYMGDGIMVIFGAPLPLEDHALRAVKSAVAMVRKVRSLQDTWAALGKPDLRMGVGIHTGRVVVGTVGSPRRLDYSAIGDTTNTAARIEAQTRKFDCDILISSETYQDLPGSERAQLGRQAEGRPAEVKGKKQTLKLHVVDAV